MAANALWKALFLYFGMALYWPPYRGGHKVQGLRVLHLPDGNDPALARLEGRCCSCHWVHAPRGAGTVLRAGPKTGPAGVPRAKSRIRICGNGMVKRVNFIFESENDTKLIHVWKVASHAANFY